MKHGEAGTHCFGLESKTNVKPLLKNRKRWNLLDSLEIGDPYSTDKHLIPQPNHRTTQMFGPNTSPTPNSLKIWPNHHTILLHLKNNLFLLPRPGAVPPAGSPFSRPRGCSEYSNISGGSSPPPAARPRGISEAPRRVAKQRRDPGPSYGGVGPESGAFGYKRFGIESPGALKVLKELGWFMFVCWLVYS